MQPKKNIPSDETLVARFKFDRDMEAFDLLHDRYRQAVLNYLCRYVGDYQKAEELTQETFIRVYRHLPDFQQTGRVSGWIYAIATNLARMEFRREKKHQGTVSMNALFTRDGEELELEDFIPNHRRRPDRIARAKEIAVRVQEGIEALPEKFREVFILCALEGFSYREAAGALKIGEGTVCSRLVRAKKKFAEALELAPGKPISSELVW